MAEKERMSDIVIQVDMRSPSQYHRTTTNVYFTVLHIFDLAIKLLISKLCLANHLTK